jgi:hypothetical protein
MESVPGGSGVTEKEKSDGSSLQFVGQTGGDELSRQFAQPFLDEEKERPPPRKSGEGIADSVDNPHRCAGQRFRPGEKLDKPFPVCH